MSATTASLREAASAVAEASVFDPAMIERVLRLSLDGMSRNQIAGKVHMAAMTVGRIQLAAAREQEWPDETVFGELRRQLESAAGGLSLGDPVFRVTRGECGAPSWTTAQRALVGKIRRSNTAAVTAALFRVSAPTLPDD